MKRQLKELITTILLSTFLVAFTAYGRGKVIENRLYISYPIDSTTRVAVFDISAPESPIKLDSNSLELSNVSSPSFVHFNDNGDIETFSETPPQPPYFDEYVWHTYQLEKGSFKIKYSQEILGANGDLDTFLDGRKGTLIKGKNYLFRMYSSYQDGNPLAFSRNVTGMSVRIPELWNGEQQLPKEWALYQDSKRLFLINFDGPQISYQKKWDIPHKTSEGGCGDANLRSTAVSKEDVILLCLQYGSPYPWLVHWKLSKDLLSFEKRPIDLGGKIPAAHVSDEMFFLDENLVTISARYSEVGDFMGLIEFKPELKFKGTLPFNRKYFEEIFTMGRGYIYAKTKDGHLEILKYNKASHLLELVSRTLLD